VKEKRERFENEAVLQDKRQTRVPGLYQVYTGYLDCYYIVVARKYNIILSFLGPMKTR